MQSKILSQKNNRKKKKSKKKEKKNTRDIISKTQNFIKALFEEEEDTQRSSRCRRDIS